MSVIYCRFCHLPVHYEMWIGWLHNDTLAKILYACVIYSVKPSHAISPI